MNSIAVTPEIAFITGAGAGLVAAVGGIIPYVVVGAIILIAAHGDTAKSKEDETLLDDDANLNSEISQINIGMTGYVQGIDVVTGDLGLGIYRESFELNTPFQDIFENIEVDKLNVLKSQIGDALNVGNYVLAQTLINTLNQKLNNKSFETYVKFGKYGTNVQDMIYIGKTSGKYNNLLSPKQHVDKRNRKYRKMKPDFMDSILDKSTHITGNPTEEPNVLIALMNQYNVTIAGNSISFPKNTMNYFAVAGREQILIEEFGGIGHPKLENEINSVSRNSPMYNIAKDLAKLYYGVDVNDWEIPDRPSKDYYNTEINFKTTWITVKDLKKKMGI